MNGAKPVADLSHVLLSEDGSDQDFGAAAANRHVDRGDHHVALGRIGQVVIATHHGNNTYVVAKLGLEVVDEPACKIVVLLDNHRAGDGAIGCRELLKIGADVKGDKCDFVLAHLNIHGGRKAVGDIDRHVVDRCVLAFDLRGERVGVAYVVDSALVGVKHMQDELQAHRLVDKAW